MYEVGVLHSGARQGARQGSRPGTFEASVVVCIQVARPGILPGNEARRAWHCTTTIAIGLLYSDSDGVVPQAVPGMVLVPLSWPPPRRSRTPTAVGCTISLSLSPDGGLDLDDGRTSVVVVPPRHIIRGIRRPPGRQSISSLSRVLAEPLRNRYGFQD